MITIKYSVEIYFKKLSSLLNLEINREDGLTDKLKIQSF